MPDNWYFTEQVRRQNEADFERAKMQNKKMQDAQRPARSRMANYLGLSPTDEAGWPIDLIDRLRTVEFFDGHDALHRELDKLNRK
jgi:hypothetical protein